MPSKYERAETAILEEAYKLMRDNHPDLHTAGATVEIFFGYASRNSDDEQVGHAYKDRRKQPINAVSSKTNLLNRVAGHADICIELCGDSWESLPVEQQVMLIDRELQSFAVAKDAEDGVILDSHGRPKLKRRLPDFEVSIYTAIASRHKEASIEAISMAQIYQQAGQAVFPFLGQQEFAALPDPDAAEPEGKKKKGKK
jgi:hypothetical protein